METEESALRAAMRALPHDAASPLRLGVMECLVPFIRPALTGSGTPPLKITTGGLVELLRGNQLEAVLAFNLPRVPELRIHAEREYSLGVVHAPGLSPVGDPPSRLEDCLAQPLCLPDASLSVWPRLDAEVYRAHAYPQIVLRSNSIALILDFVAAGRGLSFLNWLDAAARVARGELCFAPLASRRLADRLTSAPR